MLILLKEAKDVLVFALLDAVLFNGIMINVIFIKQKSKVSYIVSQKMPKSEGTGVLLGCWLSGVTRLKQL